MIHTRSYNITNRLPGRLNGRQISRTGVAVPCDDSGVLVMARNEDGQWMMWRVGRHRLAWRPRGQAHWNTPGYRYNPVGLRYKETSHLLNWVAAVVATAVVWPWRAMTGRWPVVAYVLDPYDGDSRQQRTGPLPRAEAHALACRWAEHIKHYGRPPIDRDS